MLGLAARVTLMSKKLPTAGTGGGTSSFSVARSSGRAPPSGAWLDREGGGDASCLGEAEEGEERPELGRSRAGIESWSRRNWKGEGSGSIFRLLRPAQQLQQID